MILFDNKTKIKWEHDTSIERKFFKKSKAQTLASQILKDEIEKKTKKKTCSKSTRVSLPNTWLVREMIEVTL